MDLEDYLLEIFVALAGMMVGLMLGCICSQPKTFRAGRESVVTELCRQQEYDFCAKKYELINNWSCDNE